MNVDKEKLRGTSNPIFPKVQATFRNNCFSDRVTNAVIQKNKPLFLDLKNNIIDKNNPEQMVWLLRLSWKYSLLLVRLQQSCIPFCVKIIG